MKRFIMITSPFPGLFRTPARLEDAFIQQFDNEDSIKVSIKLTEKQRGEFLLYEITGDKIERRAASIKRGKLTIEPWADEMAVKGSHRILSGPARIVGYVDES